MRTEQRHTLVDRLAAWGGLAGPVVFTLLVITGGAVTEGYSHVTQKISELGATGAQYAWLQNLNFAVLGVAVVGFAWALTRTRGRPVVGPALVAVFGAVVFLHAFLSCDAGCSGQTTAGLLHNVTGLMGFGAAIGGMFVLAARWSHDPTWRSHAVPTRIAAIVASVGLASFVATQALDVQTFAGVAQRIFAAALLAWIAITGARLVRLTNGTIVPPNPPGARAEPTRPS